MNQQAIFNDYGKFENHFRFIRSIISKAPRYRLPSQIEFNKCREEITVAINEFCKRWCRRGHECNVLYSWKIAIFNIIEKRISFYSNTLTILISYHLNLNLFPKSEAGYPTIS